MRYYIFGKVEDRTLAKKIGRLVRDLRTKKGLSQEQYADHCGLHRTYVGAIERGEKAITIETANKLAGALGLSLAQLFQKLEGGDYDNEHKRH